MKKITAMLIMFVTLLMTVQAQTPADIEVYRQQEQEFWEKALQKIKSKINTGILYTKATPFSNLYNYNTTTYNTSHAALFRQSLSELYESVGKTQFMDVKNLDRIK